MNTKKSPYFWLHVLKGEGCWEWQRGLDANGYGAFWTGSNKVLTHRFSWAATNGPIPEGMMICHHCDNRKCVRPSHLFLGTAGDNNRDAIAKKRWTAAQKIKIGVYGGEKHGAAKLKQVDIPKMKELKSCGLSYRQVGSFFGVSHATARRAVLGINWK